MKSSYLTNEDITGTLPAIEIFKAGSRLDHFDKSELKIYHKYLKRKVEIKFKNTLLIIDESGKIESFLIDKKKNIIGINYSFDIDRAEDKYKKNRRKFIIFLRGNCKIVTLRCDYEILT